MQVEQSGTVKRPSRQRQSTLAHEAKKMRVDDDNMELLTVVHDEPAVPEEPQVPTLPPFRDEMTGDLLQADLTLAAQEKELETWRVHRGSNISKF